jgi:hypothetical protein
MISDYYDREAEVSRLSTVTGYKQAFTPYLSSLPCHIQPIQDAFSQDMGGGFGKDFMMFCDLADVVEGDRVVIGGLEYRVMGLSRHSFRDHEHMEVRLRVFDNPA